MTLTPEQCETIKARGQELGMKFDLALYDIVDVKRVGPDELQAIVRCRNQDLSKVMFTIERVEDEV